MNLPIPESAVVEPDFKTTKEALERAASLWPHAEALIVGDRRFSYAELYNATVLAAKNLHRLGLRAGENLAICLGNSPDWVITAYAANFLGAVVVPVNTRFKANELRYCLEQSNSVFLVVADKFLKIDFIEMLREIEPAIDRSLPGGALPCLRALITLGQDTPAGAISYSELFQAGAPDLPSQAPQGSDVAIMQYTSGTTAFPKGVMLTHENVTRIAWHVSARIGLREGDRYFSGRPLFHVAGSTLSMLASCVMGACYLTEPVYEPGKVLSIMDKERCTATSGNDTMFLALMNHPTFASTKLYLRSALAAVSREVAIQMVEKMNLTGLCTGYGLSEASPTCSMGPYSDEMEKRISGFAFPLPGVEMGIFDPEGYARLPSGEHGEIRIRGWNVMKGYYMMPEATSRAIDEQGWLHTGDLGVADDAGRFRFVDRLKDMFRVGGENVAPADVENVLNAHSAVLQAQVVGVPDQRLGEVAAAYVILKNETHVSGEELIQWCTERCANFKVPRFVRIVDSFEAIGMTGSSKVQRNKLRAHAIVDLGLE